MTAAEMAEAVATARELLLLPATGTVEGCGTVQTVDVHPGDVNDIARALLASQRQVEALTKERDAAIRTAVDHQRVNNSLTVKLDEYLTGRKVTSMLATERTRVVEAIARRFDTEAIRWAILRDQHGDASDSLKCKWLSDKATEDASHIRDTNWALPEEKRQ